MTAFEPGEGWRRVGEDEYPETGLIRWTPDDPNEPEVYWVREEPVPTLPTEPYTVIRVTWKPEVDDDVVVFTLNNGAWYDAGGDALDPADITGFEVVAQPIAALVRADEEAIQIERQRERDQVRHETAKAVLTELRNRVASHVSPGFELMPDGSEDPESAGYVAGLASAVGVIDAELRKQVFS